MDSSSSISPQNLQIFKTICELIASSEFQDATFSYLDQNKEPFTDDDENKLEYTVIFENYVQILEQVIDAKLYATYSQEAIQGFYFDFKDNWKLYEAQDSEAVETLFGFIDFNKFKKQVLEFKTGQVDWKKDNPVADYSKKDTTFFFKVLAEDVNDPSTQWKKKLNMKDKDVSMEIWQRPSPDDDHMCRIDLDIYGVSMEAFKAFVQDLDNSFGKGSKMVKQMNILERDENGMPAAMHNVMKMPLMNEREGVIKLNFQEQNDGKYLFMMHSYERDDIPITKDRIRLDLFKGMQFWPIENGIRSVQLQQMNMKGHFPMRLMNMAVSNAAKKQIKEIMVPRLREIQKEIDAK